MQNDKVNKAMSAFQKMFKSHPWHGVSIGEDAPKTVRAYIEVVPTDTMKYEVCKESGYLMIDRPNKYSNNIPVLYGFIPQTYCAEETAAYSAAKANREDLVGDGDPLDICVLTDRQIPHGDLLIDAIIVGGFRMIDGGEADDKLIAVLKKDHTYGDIRDIKDCPEKLIRRIKHYFLTYKENPDAPDAPQEVEITHTYGREEALEVLAATQNDYAKHFGHIQTDFAEAFKALIQEA